MFLNIDLVTAAALGITVVRVPAYSPYGVAENAVGMLLSLNRKIHRLITFPNVLITGHQAYFTAEALSKIAETTLANITDFAESRPCANEVRA